MLRAATMATEVEETLITGTLTAGATPWDWDAVVAAVVEIGVVV